MNALIARPRLEVGTRGRAAAAGVAVIAGAGLLRWVYGAGTIGYDAIWALVWGDQLVQGDPVVLDAAGAPTPHPLAIAISAPASLLGAAGIDAVLALSWLAFALLGALAFALGRELYSAWVGAVFAALVLTRPQLVLETQQALIDIPFLALALGAMLATARHGRDGWIAPTAARDRRPAAPGGVAADRRVDGVGRRRTAAGPGRATRRWRSPRRCCGRRRTCSRPATRCSRCIATRDLAVQLARPRGLEDGGAARAGVAARDADGAGRMARACRSRRWRWCGWNRATFLPAAVAGLGLLTFLVLGVAGLPVLKRYLLLPATLLALWCAVAAVGFTVPGRASGPGEPAPRSWRCSR